MTIQEEFLHKKILIVGYGKEGKAAEKFIQHFFPHAHYEVVDQKDGPHYLDKQNDFDIAIKSPGVKKSLIQIPYTTGTNIFFNYLDEKHTTIGVTGTKGKSTTTALIYHILKINGKTSRLAGNIGKPLIEELLAPQEVPTIYVCELSSYQLEDIQHSPHIAVAVSLFPEHMNYHGSVESYFEAKSHIIKYSKPQDIFVYNPKFQILSEWAKSSDAYAIPYDTSHQYKINLLGPHNKENVQAASTVCKLFDLTEDDIQKALDTFEPLPHRLQHIGTFKGISFYDDAISTTPESTIAALVSIPDVKTILLGGEDRGYDFTQLVKVLKTQQIEHIVLFPDSGAKIKEMIKLSDYEPHFFETRDMKQAVEYCFKHTPKGSVALLSTASPSYSVWKNFEEKGDLFARYVKEFGV